MRRKKGKSEMEKRLYYYVADKGNPPVEIIRQRPMKLKRIPKKKLTREESEFCSKMNTELSVIEDPEFLDEKGHLHFEVDPEAPRDLIIYLINEYLDRYGKKGNARFRTDLLEEGFNISENGKSLHQIAKEFHNTKDNATDNPSVKAKYEQLKRANKRVKKSFLNKSTNELLE